MAEFTTGADISPEPFVRYDCPTEESSDADKQVHLNSKGSSTSSSTSSIKAWRSLGLSFSGVGWMKDTLPVNLTMSPLDVWRREQHHDSLLPPQQQQEPKGQEEGDAIEMVVYAQVTERFLDRWERQYGRRRYRNWHEYGASQDRRLVSCHTRTS